MQLTTAMLADGAHVAGGKLYILGGQWDRVGGVVFPLQHPSMAVVLVIKVDYDEALTQHRLNVALMLDGEPVGPSATGEMATGHAPGQARGAPGFVSVALPFNNVTFEAPGRYEWVVTVDDEPIGQLPIEVVRVNLPGYPSTAPH
ncbi:MAG TPA: hypothetical protein VHZ03_24675 [Trebonia sp.]|jgi:hypothetical protein|nr:hypothetical protein [Trebonia sp.]